MVACCVCKPVQSVPHSRIREPAEVAFWGRPVFSLYFGESDQPTPGPIKQAAVDALAAGHTLYTENAGTPSLRQALATEYQRLQNVELDPRREIVVTASGVQALNVAIRCVLDPGDEAIVLTPAWPNGSSNIAMARARAVQVAQPMRDGRYEIDWEGLDASVSDRA